MPIFKKVLWLAAQRIASDPKMRAKVSTLVEKEIKPRAEAEWNRISPKVRKISDKLGQFANKHECEDRVDSPKDTLGGIAALKDIKSKLAKNLLDRKLK